MAVTRATPARIISPVKRTVLNGDAAGGGVGSGAFAEVPSGSDPSPDPAAVTPGKATS